MQKTRLVPSLTALRPLLTHKPATPRKKGRDSLKLFLICTVLPLGLIGACAKKSENVAASYVSPLAYQQFNCRQLAEEAGRISQWSTELSGVQNRKRTGDIVATTAAIVVFWPAAFLVSGDDAQTAELAPPMTGRVSGHFAAVFGLGDDPNVADA